MAEQTPSLGFLTDNNVPDSIGAWLIERGHDVHRMRDLMPNDSPDPVVAVAALDAGLLLVSQDKDFNAQRFAQAKFARLKRIGLIGPGPTLLAALKQHIHLIEAHCAWAERETVERVTFQVGLGQIRIRSSSPEAA
jgi:hypothetical protein